MAWITTDERTLYRWHDVPSDEVPSDRDMKATLVARLKENLYTQDADIRVEVDGRVVVLIGAVEDETVRRVAGEDAWDVPGVVDVSNQLRVAPG